MSLPTAAKASACTQTLCCFASELARTRSANTRRRACAEGAQRAAEEAERVHPGLSPANTRAYCSHSSPPTSSPRSAARFTPATCRPRFDFQHQRQIEGAALSYGSDLVRVPPHWESPGLQSVHHHDTTPLLYRASRRVLDPAAFLAPGCARFAYWYKPPDDNNNTIELKTATCFQVLDSFNVTVVYKTG